MCRGAVVKKRHCHFWCPTPEKLAKWINAFQVFKMTTSAKWNPNIYLESQDLKVHHHYPPVHPEATLTTSYRNSLGSHRRISCDSVSIQSPLVQLRMLTNSWKLMFACGTNPQLGDFLHNIALCISISVYYFNLFNYIYNYLYLIIHPRLFLEIK